MERKDKQGQQGQQGNQRQQGQQSPGQQGQQHPQGQGQQGQQNRQGQDQSKVEGEGSYTASKDYNERTKKFVESGKVDQAAKDAQPSDDTELNRMKDAERTGQKRSKGEDPALRDPGKIKDDPNFPRKPGKPYPAGEGSEQD